MRRALGYVLALAMILAGGYAHGVWTGRWSSSPELAGAVARLDRVPTTIGAWKGEDRRLEDQELVMEIGGIRGLVSRRYVDSDSGDWVSMLLVCGLPGRIAVHTPDICFAGSGYVPKTRPERVGVAASGSGAPAEFMREDFGLTTPEGPIGTRVYWAWGTGDRWQAPDYPRWEFKSKPYLYKLYVTCGPRGEPSGDPATGFLRVLLPELRRALAPDAGHRGAPPAGHGA